MIAVIFGVEPHDGRHDDHLAHAAALRAELETVDGFVSVERFESPTTPGKLLSLMSRDEEAVARWRNHPMHREIQFVARDSRFRDCTLRVAAVIRGRTMQDRAAAPTDSLAAL